MISELELKRMTMRLITGKFRQFINTATVQMEELISRVELGKFDSSDSKDRTALQLMQGIIKDGRADMLRRLNSTALDLEARANVETLNSAELGKIAESVLAMIEEFESTRAAFNNDQEAMQKAIKQSVELN